ncbi:MAG TPA: DUF6178 family protein [Methylomirabilota bacterium]|nr:DUF6178 family protein [Methylomirabilota bacterium]
MEALIQEQFAALSIAEQVVRLEQADARTRQQLILAARNSLALTRALSSEKLFYTLKEIGLADAVDLLALASPEQVRDMMDLDCWRKDMLDDRRVATWLMLLDEAGSGKLAEWALHADIELLVLLVKRHFEIIRKSDVEEDPDFDQSQYFTFDDQYLLRFIGEEEPILSLVLERLRVLDYENYKQVLEWSLLELESSLEEEALRWRNARLADRGYPDYEEAREAFRVVAPASLSLARYRRAGVEKVRYAADEELIPADHALMLLDVRESLLVRSLAALPAEYVEQIGHELAILTNKVVVAEACDPGEVAEVRKCVEAVHDYINIGLEYFTHTEKQDAARLLQETSLSPFFQTGVSLVLRLPQRARDLGSVLQRQVGAAWAELLDSPFRETYAGVRRRPPVFFRGLETAGEIFFRRFRTLAEVERVEALLDQMPVWFAVLQRWRMLPEDCGAKGVSLAALWNTMLVHWVSRGQVEVRPLTRAELSAFQKRLRDVPHDVARERFLSFAAAHLSLAAEETAALRALDTFAFEKLEETLATDLESADVRFIEGVLVERGKPVSLNSR